MTKRSLVIGMGIGQLYKAALEELGYEVVTVDSDISKRANFPNVQAAVVAYGPFETAHICTPNFTHESLAYQVAPHAKIVFVEKPGVMDSDTWKLLVTANPRTRFMMVKNNQWRDNIAHLKELAGQSARVHVNWLNVNRVPSPGSWFTNKELSYGGVSRDLMPHLLSIFMALEPDFEKSTKTHEVVKQNWQLKDLTDSDYGTVKEDGVYNVDDECIFEFNVNNRYWYLNANWRTMDYGFVGLQFMDENSKEFANVELGLCPGTAYVSMIKDAVDNYTNPDFWKKQFIHDTWIHDRVSR